MPLKQFIAGYGARAMSLKGLNNYDEILLISSSLKDFKLLILHRALSIEN